VHEVEAGALHTDHSDAVPLPDLRLRDRLRVGAVGLDERKPSGPLRDELGRLIQSLTDEMHDAARDLRFEEAARLRDEIHEMKRELREVG